MCINLLNTDLLCFAQMAVFPSDPSDPIRRGRVNLINDKFTMFIWVATFFSFVSEIPPEIRRLKFDGELAQWPLHFSSTPSSWKSSTGCNDRVVEGLEHSQIDNNTESLPQVGWRFVDGDHRSNLPVHLVHTSHFPIFPRSGFLCRNRAFFFKCFGMVVLLRI